MIKRNPKDSKIEAWEHSSGVQTIIYICGTTFYAFLLEKWFEAPDAGILKKKLRDYAEVWNSITWHPMIVIETEGASGGGHWRRERVELEASVKFGCKRYYLGTSPAGEIYHVDWETDESHRKAKMEVFGSSRWDGSGKSSIKLIGLPLKSPMKLNAEQYLLDYTEATWQAALAILSGIATLREQITPLFATKEGVSKLLGGADPLLLTSSK